MVKVTLVTSGMRKNVIVNGNTSIRDVLDSNEVVYGNAATALDGVVLGAGDINKTLDSYGVTDRCVVSVLPYKDNGANAVIIGSACVIKSNIKLEDIQRCKELDPDALRMVDEDGDDVFRIDIDEDGPGCINEYGVCFSGTAEADGSARVTLVMDPNVENAEDLIYKKLGKALLKLTDMEEHMAEIIPVLNDEENLVKSMITRI